MAQYDFFVSFFVVFFVHFFFVLVISNRVLSYFYCICWIEKKKEKKKKFTP